MIARDCIIQLGPQSSQPLVSQGIRQQQLVQLTDAVMLLSESALKDYLRMGLVRALPVCIDVPMAPFGILTRTDDAPTQEQQRFIALLRAQARGLAQAG